MSTTQWIKSSYSGGEGGNCLEWAPTHATTHNTVPIRDSKNPQGAVLTFPTPAFTTFTAFISRIDPGGYRP